MISEGRELSLLNGVNIRTDSMDAVKITTKQAQNAAETGIKTKTDKKELTAQELTRLNEFEKRSLPVSDKVILDAIDRINKVLSGINRRFEYSIHEKTKEVIIKVINSDTNEVVREIPPEKILDMIAKIWEMAGLIVDERR